MTIATKNDKKEVVEILTEAFIDNQSVNYIIKHKRNLGEIRALMSYSFDTCLMFGRILISENRDACALMLYPHKKNFRLAAIWLDIKLIFKVIGLSRIPVALNRESQIKTLRPKLPMMYVWFIGVQPRSQNQGIGTKLIGDIIKVAIAEDLPLYLETSTTANIPWYEKLGFKIYTKLDLSYSLYFLRR